MLTQHKVQENRLLGGARNKAVDDMGTGEAFAFEHFFYLIAKQPQLQNAKRGFRGETKEDICLESEKVC